MEEKTHQTDTALYDNVVVVAAVVVAVETKRDCCCSYYQCYRYCRIQICSYNIRTRDPNRIDSKIRPKPVAAASRRILQETTRCRLPRSHRKSHWWRRGKLPLQPFRLRNEHQTRRNHWTNHAYDMVDCQQMPERTPSFSDVDSHIWKRRKEKRKRRRRMRRGGRNMDGLGWAEGRRRNDYDETVPN